MPERTATAAADSVYWVDLALPAPRTAAAARQWLQYLDWEAAREGRPDRG